jgi:hypothetical protein
MQLALTTIASAVLVALTAAGCSGPTTPTPITASRSIPAGGPTLADATAGQHASTLPVSGTCNTSFDPPTFPLPPVIRQVDNGTCQLAHLGRTAIYLLQDINLVAGTQTSLELTLTAANGDVLRGSNVGTHVSNGPTSVFSSVLTLTGGTGRFANATGQWRLEGTADHMTNTATFTVVDGWITYDASDRASP